MGEPIRLNVDKVFDSVKGAITGIHHSVEVKVVFITDDHIRAIHARMLSMGLTFPAIEQPTTPDRDLPPSAYTCTGAYSFANYPIKGWTDKTSTPAPTSPMAWTGTPEGQEPRSWNPPASPVDDEATVPPGIVALIRLLERVGHTSVFSDSELAHEIYAMVRRGEVSGLTTTAEAQEALSAAAEDRYFTIAELKNEHDTLKAEVERLRDEVAQRIRERDHYSEQSSRWIAERDTLKAEVERLKEEAQRMARIYARDMDDRQEKLNSACARAHHWECEWKASELRLKNSESMVLHNLEAEHAAIARAEAAEALLREVRGPSPLTEYGLDELRSRIDAHLAKHGGKS